MKKILFVCSANKQRSKTAEDYFSENFFDLEFYSAGTNIKLCEKEGTNPLTKNELENADVIFVMESKHRTEINKVFGNKYAQKTEILHIPDIFKYYQKELVEILKRKVIYKIS